MAEAGAPVEAHLERILALVTPPAPVAVPVADALGLVTAADVVAPLDLPRFDHAAMDGYAVRAVDLAGGAEPVSLPVAGVVAAGDAARPTLLPGTAWRIMTGAPVPAGADAVVPFEWTDRGAERVEIRRSVVAAANVRRAGEDVVAGRVALLAGTKLAPRHLAFLTAIGCASVVVRPAPRVAVVTTGEELARPGVADLGQARIPDSNSVALVAAARSVGAAAVSHATVPDDAAALVAHLDRLAEEADLVVTTGGISAGDHDVVKGALAERPGFWFGSVAVKPGRPQGCGVLVATDGRRVPVVCLPGTPVAAYASFRLFAEPAIRALGCRPAVLRDRAVLGTAVASAPDRTLLLPAVYGAAGRVTQLAGHVGHSQRLLAAADVLLVVPPGGAELPVGTEVAVLPL